MVMGRRTQTLLSGASKLDVCLCGAEGLVLWTFVKQVSPSGRAGTGEACRASGALSPLVVKHTKIKANVSLLGRHRSH